MNYKVLPYPRTQRFTDQTADYFLHGVDGEPLKWGNLAADIYVDPISDNMGVVQRQTMMLCANYEAERGNLDKARELLLLCDSIFPQKNFPHDIYAAYIYTGSNSHVDVVALYRRLLGDEKATELWNEVFEYYRQEALYLQQFKGEKAAGVRSQLQGNDLQIIGLLGEMAEISLQNKELAAKANDLLQQFGPYYSL